MLTVTLNNPNYEPGELIGISSLGAFINGEPKEITAEEEAVYYAAKGKLVSDLPRNLFVVVGNSEFTPDTPAVTTPPQVVTPPVEPSQTGEPHEETERSDEA